MCRQRATRPIRGGLAGADGQSIGRPVRISTRWPVPVRISGVPPRTSRTSWWPWNALPRPSRPIGRRWVLPACSPRQKLRQSASPARMPDVIQRQSVVPTRFVITVGVLAAPTVEIVAPLWAKAGVLHRSAASNRIWRMLLVGTRTLRRVYHLFGCAAVLVIPAQAGIHHRAALCSGGSRFRG
jgi:hypothetical protein